MPATAARRSRRDVLRMGAGALGAALVAACTGGSEEPPPPSPIAAPRSTIDVLDGYPGAAGPRGGVVRLGAVGRRGLNDASLPLTHAQLVAVDPRSARVYADLAQAVELVDPLTAVFTLRPELRFHPDAAGVVAALTAESVVRDFEVRTSAGEYLFSEVIEQVTAADEAALRMQLRGPFSLLFEFLADPATGAVRSPERSPVTRGLLGAGPFTPATREASGDVLARNPRYHRQGLPLLEGAVLVQFESEQALAQAFAEGRLDLHHAVDEESAPNAAAAAARADALVIERPSFSMLGFGLSLLPEKGGRAVRSITAFQDARVRRAVSLALDREAFAAAVGNAVVSGPVGPAHGADALSAAALDAHALHRHDPAAARALLDAAGEPELAFRVQLPESSLAAGQLLEQQLAAGGFAPRLQPLEAAESELGFHAGDFEATLFELSGLRTPDVGLRLHSSDGLDGFSLWGYSNPSFDAAVRGALSELDPALRARRSREAQRLLLDDVPAMFPLAVPLERASIDPRVRGFEYDGYGFNDSWLAARWSV